jgi:ADP-heptose:LPS heptosyltransferase
MKTETGVYKASEPKPIPEQIKLKTVLLYGRVSNLLLNLVQRIIFRKHRSPEKILVFRTGSIGDNICAMPAIANLKRHFPDANLQLLTNAGKGLPDLVSFEALIAPGIFEKIINYENLSPKELSIILRKEQFDLVIQFSQLNAPISRMLRDMFYFRFVIGIRHGFGWMFNSPLFFKQIQEKYLHRVDERTRLNNILVQNGIPVREIDVFNFHVADTDHLKVEKALQRLPLGNRPCLAMVPGAKRPQNRWPIEYFETVARHYCREYNIFLIGGPEDAVPAERIAELPNTFSFCGALTPVQSGLLMQRCQLVLSNDTGPMHLSYAFGVPVTAIFSNRDFSGRWFPPQDGKNVVHRATNIACAICLGETCSNNICMKNIDPHTVIESMRKTLTQI